MTIACRCGKVYHHTELLPAYVGDGEWGAECPFCGMLDALDWMGERKAEAIEFLRRIHAESEPVKL